MDAEETGKPGTPKHNDAAKIHRLVESQLQPLLIEYTGVQQKKRNTLFFGACSFKTAENAWYSYRFKRRNKTAAARKRCSANVRFKFVAQQNYWSKRLAFYLRKNRQLLSPFMLDEFQDTSGLQWNNFKPLIINSLAEGNKNLLVGDVKQAIYRWRNSDYSILAEQINRDFSANQIDEHFLEKNWRSDINIIGFNNQIFENLKNVFEELLSTTVDDITIFY